jgi:bidirectional [NiFe] hydrogenase diaphorase subunit
MRPVAAVKTLKIDGRDVSGREDESILHVAQQNGIFIPRLCEMDGLTDVGACRLCLVEIKGQNKLLPACVTAVEEGMEVTTDSERLNNYRRMILELLFTERNHVCSVCVSNGHCEMQMLAQSLGITHVHFPYRYPKEEVDASHDRFVIDHNRCILCTRCVRVCDEIEGAHTWDLMAFGHVLSPQAILGLALQLYGSTPRSFCATVTGANFEHGESLSPPVAAALPGLINRIRTLIEWPRQSERRLNV